MKTLIIFLLSMIYISANSQEYIVFEEQTGVNNRDLLKGLTLSNNNVELVAEGTSINLYNWLFSPQAGFSWETLSPSFSTLSKKLLNNLVIVAVPLQTNQKSYRELSQKVLDSFNIITTDTLLARSLLDLNKHMLGRTAQMPALKTIAYGLIIKKNNIYYLVDGPILITQFITTYEPSYFPNDFRNGSLAINPENNIYDFETIDQIRRELREKNFPQKWLEKIVNRIYLAKVDKSTAFKTAVFSFWEYPNDDVESSLLNLKKLHEFNLGLGSFQYVDGVGIINATLDTFLKRKILFQQEPYFSIKRINNLSLANFLSDFNKK